MRLSLSILLTLTVALGVLSTASVKAHSVKAVVAGSSASYVQDPPKVNVDINLNKGGGGQWYANPVWMAIGGLGVLLIVVLIVMAARGGGTTVVKG